MNRPVLNHLTVFFNLGPPILLPISMPSTWADRPLLVVFAVQIQMNFMDLCLHQLLVFSQHRSLWNIQWYFFCKIGSAYLKHLPHWRRSLSTSAKFDCTQNLDELVISTSKIQFSTEKEISLESNKIEDQKI